MSDIREELKAMIEKLPEEQLQNVYSILSGVVNMTAPQEEEPQVHKLTPQELESGICDVVSTMKAVGSSEGFIVSQLVERYKISEEEAIQKVRSIEAFTI